MRTKERIKTILLVVLLCGASFLTYLTWTSYTGQNIGSAGVQGAEFFATVAQQESAMPFSISYKTEAGRFGAAYHSGSVNSIYDKVRNLIASALGDNFKEVEEPVWNEALLESQVLVDYEGNLPLFVLAKALGASKEVPEIYCRYLLVTEDATYLKDSQRDKFYACSHDLGSTEFAKAFETLNATKCATAYELGSTRVAGETLVFDNNISSFGINSINITDGFTDGQLSALLKIFGMNYNTCGRHTEKDGSRVFVEDLSTLKITPDGYLTFESEEEGELALSILTEGAMPTVEEIVEGSDGLMAELNALTGGDGVLYIREVYDDGVVKYGRSFGGIPIDKGGNGYSAELYLTGNRVTCLNYHMRVYTAGTTVFSALPQKLAIASVPGKSFGVLSLRYRDNSGGGIEAQWYVKK